MYISPQEFKDKILHQEHLPEGLRVMGYLNLGYNTSLIHLPEGLVVGGGLYLHGCTSLTHLPEGLVVNGNLNIFGCTSLTHLPKGLKVGGIIYCDKFFIDNIPKEDLPLYINYNFEEDIYEHISSRIQKGL
jgi:hypothetical protein